MIDKTIKSQMIEEDEEIIKDLSDLIKSQALTEAVKNGNREMIQALLDKKAPYRSRDILENAIYTHLHSNILNVLQCLLENGVSLGSEDDSGYLLLVSVVKSTPEVANYLIEAGASLDKALDLARTPWRESAIAGCENAIDYLQMKKELKELKDIYTPMESRFKVRL